MNGDLNEYSPGLKICEMSTLTGIIYFFTRKNEGDLNKVSTIIRVGQVILTCASSIARGNKCN